MSGSQMKHIDFGFYALTCCHNHIGPSLFNTEASVCRRRTPFPLPPRLHPLARVSQKTSPM